MAKKRTKKYRPSVRFIPPLIGLSLNKDVFIAEHMAIQGLIGGFANEHLLNDLIECRNVLTVASVKKKDKILNRVCREAYDAISSIKKRKEVTGKFGCNTEELGVLKALVEVSEDFWLRQGGKFFLECCEESEQQGKTK